MSIKYVSGDLIALAKAGEFNIIAHGCNCQKNMGAGIAKQIAKEFPESIQADKRDEYHNLGDISIASWGLLWYNTLDIVNCYTQIGIGKSFDSPKCHWSNKNSQDTTENRYKAIESCFQKINEKFKGKKLGIPKIGCGLAGLDWNIVEKLVIENLTDLDVTVVEYIK